MKTMEIFYDDLTEKAKEKFKDVYHENIDLNPLAIVDFEEDKDDDDEI